MEDFSPPSVSTNVSTSAMNTTDGPMTQDEHVRENTKTVLLKKSYSEQVCN